MTKKERFNAAYKFLYDNGFIRNQKDAAAKMGASTSNMSSAKSGVASVLTDSFIKRFCEAYPAISEDWLLTESGEMLTMANNISTATNSTNELDRLKKENQELQKENERLRIQNETLWKVLAGFGYVAPVEQKRNVG